MSDQKDKFLYTKGISFKASGSKGFVGPLTNGNLAAAGPVRIQINLDARQAAELLSELSGQVNSTNGQILGVKFDIHAGQKTTKDGSSRFDGAYYFVKALQKTQSNAHKFNTSDMERAVGGTTTRFVPVSKDTDTDVA